MGEWFKVVFHLTYVCMPYLIYGRSKLNHSTICHQNVMNLDKWKNDNILCLGFLRSKVLRTNVLLFLRDKSRALSLPGFDTYNVCLLAYTIFCHSYHEMKLYRKFPILQRMTK